jgi:hypothetical protein
MTRFRTTGKTSPGLIEVIVENEIDLNGIVGCIEGIGEQLEVVERRDPNWDALSWSARGYSSITWRYHSTSHLPYRGESVKGDYRVEVGLSEVDCFISYISVSGIFYGAPPSEPFNVVSVALGMPIREDVIDAVRVRAESLLELEGVELEDFMNAFRASLMRTGCL